MISADDGVIAAGTELSETDVYTTTRLALGGPLVRIDVDAQKLADHFDAAVPIHADATLTLEALAAGVQPRAGWRRASGPAAAFRSRIEQEFDSHSRARLAALRALRAALPSDGVVFSDMTQIAYLGNYAFPAERPGLWFHPSGYGALGFALPAAIGAKIAQPTRAVVALAGDFGWQFTHQELMSAVELDLTLPIIVWNNEALGQIRDDMQAAGIAPIGVVGRNPDFMAFAGACGAAAVRVQDPNALGRELHQALVRPGPTLIEAIAGNRHCEQHPGPICHRLFAGNPQPQIMLGLHLQADAGDTKWGQSHPKASNTVAFSVEPQAARHAPGGGVQSGNLPRV
jgi:5-guanidino-2-oxopentanoate decarboxylase